MVDPKAERLARQMLAHAIRRDRGDLGAVIHDVGDTAFAAIVDLCVLAAAYIAIDASGMAWPSDVMLRQVADDASESATRLDISGEEIFALLSRVAFGSEKLDDIFPVQGAGPAPLYATASLLLTYCPQGMDWPDYLDQIWNAYSAAEMIDKSVLPALMFRARKVASG
jgi:hypothetical protein